MKKGRKIKVLMLIVNLKAADGITNYALNYFRKINHNVIHMDFVVYDSENMVQSYITEIENEGSKIFTLPSFFTMYKHYKECWKILKQGKYDIIHDNSLIITIPMMFVAKQMGIQIRILHSHNSKLGETKIKEIRNKCFLPFLKMFITDYIACSMLAGKTLFGNKKFIVIPNVINAEKYRFNEEKRKEVRKSLGVENKYIVATVGRIALQKNPFFAMDVFKLVAEQERTAEYWWIGSGSLDEDLKKYIKEIGIEDKVKLFGSREDVNDLYQAMDCFFAPSLFEGFSIVSVEAQAMGLPCVLSNEVIKEIAYTDLVSFVKLEEEKKVWADKILDKRFGKRDYYEHLINSDFSDKKAGRRLEKLYENLLLQKGVEAKNNI